MNRAIWPIGIVAGIVVIFDQVSKQWATDVLFDDGAYVEKSFLGGFIVLRYVENDGVAFGMFDGAGTLVSLLVAIGVASLAAAVWRWRESITSMRALGMGLIAGGAIGNLIDRVRHEYVVDFIDVGRWPVFNLADACLTVGVVILLLDSFRHATMASSVPGSEQPG